MSKLVSVCVAALAVSAWLVGCVDSEEPADEASGSSGSGSGGSSAVAGGGGTPSGAAGAGAADSGGAGGAASGTISCPMAATASGTSPLITDFESMTSPTGTYTFESAGLLGGVYIYTDPMAPDTDPSTSMLAFAEGHDETSTQALVGQIHNATWGGGMGLWFACLDASVYQGVTFWARGSSPAGDVTMYLTVNEVEIESKGGSCPDDGTCVRPSVTFAVTDQWEEFTFTWADFTPGDAAGTEVPATGNNLFGIDFSLPNNNMSRDLELALDDFSFIE